MNSINTFLTTLTKYSKQAWMLIAVLFSGYAGFAQAPANNDPCAAATLPVAAACNYQTFTTVGATLDVGFPIPGCAGFTAATFTGTDVWFQFTVPAGGAVIINTQAGVLTDGAMALYSGDCNTMTFIECDDDDGDGAMPFIQRSGLTPGSTLFIRFWKYPGTIGGVEGTFGICVTTPPPPPANDDCAGAVPVPVNSNLTCTQFVNGTTVSATQTSGVPAPSCGPAGVNDDVWYSFVATGPTHVISLTNITGIVTDMAMSLYSGAGCGALTHVQCSDPETMTVTGLTSGQTYYIRVWTWTATAGSSASFRICVGTPPPPPANDNCAGAVSLTVNPDLNCGTVTAGTTLSALPSTGVPAPSCGATGVNDDVWYSFVATSAQHTIRLLNVTGNVTDMAMSLYSGTGCGALTHMQCSDPETMSVGGLTVGQTYYVRVWTWTATSGSYANFNICVGTPPPPPVNDNPCGAILLTVNENNVCNFQQFSTASATGTSGVPAPGCASYSGGDVWFKIVVPCTRNITVDGNTGDITDGGMAFYRGTCGNLTLMQCDDDGSNNGLMPKLTAANLNIGDTIYVRFWEYGNDVSGTFSLCVTTTLPPIVLPPLPPSPACAVAQPMCTSTAPYTIPNVSGQTPTSAPGGGIYGCLLLIPNPTYYVLNIQTSGSIELTISQTGNSGNGVDVDFVVWGPFTNAATACTQLSAGNIVDCSYLPDDIEVINIPNAVAGQVYILLVTNWGNEAGMITYQQTGGTGSSSCCPTSATNSNPLMCTGTNLNVNLFSTAVPNASYIWTGPNCYSSTQQNPTNAPVPSAPGVYTYTVTAYTATGQVCSDTTKVTVIARPTLPADTAFKICAGTTADLTTIYNTGSLVNAWTLNGGPVQNPAAVNVTGIYRLISANASGCTDTAYVNLTVDTVRSQVNVTQIVCTQTARITVTNQSGINPFEYSFALAGNTGVFQPSNEYVGTAGTYTVITRDSLGCTTTNQATITIVPEMTVNAGADVSIVTGETAQLQATVSEPPASILWSPSTSLNNATVLNPRANPTATTTYSITVTNSLGCIATDDMIVTVIPYCIKVKNAFTPNGDGINETWEVYDSYDCLTNVTVHVFNRYGNKIFESRDYRNKWQGTYNGKPVPDGTYYAVVDFTLVGGKKVTVKSDLTILR